MIGPIVGQRDQGERHRSLAAAEEFNFVPKFRIVDLVERRRAEVEACLQCGNECVLIVGIFQRDGRFDLRHVADRRAKVIVRSDDVKYEMAERHLLIGRLIGEFIGRHCLDGGNQILLLPRQDLLNHGRDWILLLGEQNSRDKK